MYELLAKANIVYGNKNLIVDALDKIISYITTDGMYSTPVSNKVHKRKKTCFWICNLKKERSKKLWGEKTPWSVSYKYSL